MALEQLAGGGGRDAGGAAFEKRAAELVLERAHAAGEGGLGELEALGGAVEAAVLDDEEEGAEELEVHAVQKRGMRAAHDGKPFRAVGGAGGGC